MILGYLSALFIGLSLGILGGGGSILTVPSLIYLFHLDAKSAIGMSLGVVAITSTIGIFKHYQ